MLTRKKIVWSALLTLSLIAVAAQTGALRSLVSSNYVSLTG